MIKDLRSRGCFIKDIANKLACSDKTVSRALKRQGPPPARKVGVRKSKLDDFKSRIDQCLADGIWNAEAIYTLLVKEGYTGGKSILRSYIHPKRALREAQATTRFETHPGEQLQHDWGELILTIAGEQRKVYISVNVLGFSRRFFVWAAPCNSGFLSLASHYSFTPRACKPYRARTKGKVERMVRYVKEHFFLLYQEFESFAHLNQLLEQWLRDVADRRVHHTLKEVVSERFLREQPELCTLPYSRFDTSYHETRRVPVDRYINVRSNRYSVPDHLTDQMVRLRIGLDGYLRIFDQQETLVAVHLLSTGRNQWLRQDGHHAILHNTVHVQTRDLSCYEEVL